MLMIIFFINVRLYLYPKVFISEVLPNPAGDEETSEFIEIYNPNEKTVDLKDWKLQDSSSTGQFLFSKSDKIKAREFLVIYRQKFKFALNNSGGEVVKLIAPNHEIKSEVKYQSAKENISYNFDLVKSKWRWSKFLTPGKINKFNHLPTFKLDKPKKAYKNMYAEFKVDKLKDKDGDKIKITWDFGDGHKSYLEETKHRYKKTGRYVVRLFVKDGSEEVVREFKVRVRKYPKYKLKIVGLMPNPNGKDAGKEIILIKNLGKKKIDLKEYKIGTGRSKDKIAGHPFYDNFEIKPGEIKRLVNKNICKFNLLNQGGVVQLIYPDGKVAAEVEYRKDKIFPDEVYRVDEKSGQWYWQGGIDAKEGINMNNIKILGTKNTFVVDVTLDNNFKICKTTKQIKRDNWINSWKQSHKWLISFL